MSLGADNLGPSYSDHCALILGDEDCPRSDASNLAVLSAVAALDVQFAPIKHDETDGLSQELQQLDNKINVLIQMFAGFWRQQSALPEAIPVEVSVQGLRLPAEGLAAPENTRCVRIYLHDALPQALVLPVAAVERQGETWVLRFAELSSELEDALSRHVFRRHRRAVAQSKNESGGTKFE